MPRAVLIALAVTALAGAAHAQSPEDALRAAVMAPKAMSRPGDAPAGRITLAQPYAEAYAMRTAGIAKTSIESRLAEDDDVLGAFGFLCGRQPGVMPTGAAAARGYDPNGRFLGAQLKVAFK